MTSGMISSTLGQRVGAPRERIEPTKKTSFFTCPAAKCWAISRSKLDGATVVMSVSRVDGARECSPTLRHSQPFENLKTVTWL